MIKTKETFLEGRFFSANQGSFENFSDCSTWLDTLCIGLLIHYRTRKRNLFNILFEKGLSLSYNRVMQVLTDEANQNGHAIGDRREA